MAPLCPINFNRVKAVSGVVSHMVCEDSMFADGWDKRQKGQREDLSGMVSELTWAFRKVKLGCLAFQRK